MYMTGVYPTSLFKSTVHYLPVRKSWGVYHFGKLFHMLHSVYTIQALCWIMKCENESL